MWPPLHPLSYFKIFIGLIGISLLPISIANSQKPIEPNPSSKVNYQTATILLKSGKVLGETRMKFSEGDQIKLLISSDQALEVHIHGYDIKAQLTANQQTEIKFFAHTSGRFAVTSHGTNQPANNKQHGHKALFYLEVYPQ